LERDINNYYYIIRGEKDIVKSRQPKWEREEVVLLVSEYFRTQNSILEKERSIELVSKILRQRANVLGITIDKRYRNITGVTMKYANIQSLDLHSIELGHRGLSNVSAIEREIVSEYLKYPEKINQEAYYTIMKYIRL